MCCGFYSYSTGALYHLCGTVSILQSQSHLFSILKRTSTVRIFRPVIFLRFKHLLLEVRNFGQPRALKHEEGLKSLDAISPIGLNPFDSVITYKTWASEFTKFHATM